MRKLLFVFLLAFALNFSILPASGFTSRERHSISFSYIKEGSNGDVEFVDAVAKRKFEIGVSLYCLVIAAGQNAVGFSDSS